MDQSYIRPLFWQHNESEEVLRNEIRLMKNSGIGGFIAEPRPHPFYLDDIWWNDLKILIDEAKKNDMEVWLFDDGDYPSGCAHGRIKKYHPEALKQYIAPHYIDVTGPRRYASFLIDDWFTSDESLFCICAARRFERGDSFFFSSLVDVTRGYNGGRLYWDVPDGDWRLFIIKKTTHGGEPHTQGHVNPISYSAVSAFISEVYEKTYEKLGDEFGKTIKGFFTDEPRFGNAIGYDVILGNPKYRDMPLPFCDDLLDELAHTYGDENFRRLLPCLWFDCHIDDNRAAEVRYTYMNVVSKRFGECFTGQIGKWCDDHNVKLIGHLVEENGAHGRLGYGAGHFFRATSGLHASGLDNVCNIYPGQTSGFYNTVFNYYDCDCNHWGLAKLASSAAHLDPRKNGVTVCEAFGAYGWNEGLKLMKWITDALAVRGVNFFIPHAFSPSKFPDADCPPHFYAGGNNPQWRNFKYWASYANNICNLLSDGVHVAPVAVLYHAESEWGGAAMPFEKVVKALAEDQIDCDVIPCDYICDSQKCKFAQGYFEINNERYSALVVPAVQYIPRELTDIINRMSSLGIGIFFVDNFPARSYFTGKFFPQPSYTLRSLDKISRSVKPFADISLVDKGNPEHPDLSYYHYRKNDNDIYFFVNQSISRVENCRVNFKQSGPAYLYDAMTNKYYLADSANFSDGCYVQLHIDPFSSIFVIFGHLDVKLSKMPVISSRFELDTFVVSIEGKACKTNKLINLASPDMYPDFSGVVTYKTMFSLDSVSGDIILDLGEVYELANITINSVELPGIIAPPYRCILPKEHLKSSDNKLIIEVTNTLVKSHHDNMFDRYFPQEPTGLLGPVIIYY